MLLFNIFIHGSSDLFSIFPSSYVALLLLGAFPKTISYSNAVYQLSLQRRGNDIEIHPHPQFLLLFCSVLIRNLIISFMAPLSVSY